MFLSLSASTEQEHVSVYVKYGANTANQKRSPRNTPKHPKIGYPT